MTASTPKSRTREHVNPLRLKFQLPIVLPDGWPASEFADLSLPFHIDIGPAKGRFLLYMATKHPETNFLGLEIRAPLVVQANIWRDEQRLRNVHFLSCNANAHLSTVLSALPTSSLRTVSIQFPDPYFKKRHRKRRVVQPELVRLIGGAMPLGGHVHLASDVEDVAENMLEVFLADGAFELVKGDSEKALQAIRALRGLKPDSAAGVAVDSGERASESRGADGIESDSDLDANEDDPYINETQQERHRRLEREAKWTPVAKLQDVWWDENPLQVRTEREICVIKDNGTVYRTVLRRVDKRAEKVS